MQDNAETYSYMVGLREIRMSCSLRKWFNDLPRMQQGVLLAVLRNCDGCRSDGPHKILVRGIRAACIKSARTSGSFNARRPRQSDLKDCAIQFVDCHFDHMPIHFVTHLMHAAEVIAYKHPDASIQASWSFIYTTIVKAMHLNIETREQFEERLKDDEEQIRRENLHDISCYQTKDYGDNTGTVNEGSKA